jgi:hypothetical protein
MAKASEKEDTEEELHELQVRIQIEDAADSLQGRGDP